jgi:hypothetical protein
MASNSSSEQRASSRPGRIRRRIGLVLLGLSYLVPVWFVLSGPAVWNLRLEPWLSWTWELPGPLAYLVIALYPATVLVFLPEILDTLRRGRLIPVLVGLTAGGLLCLAGLLSAMVLERTLGRDVRFVQLEEPGVFERAVLHAESMGRDRLYVNLWVVRRGGDEFEVIMAGCRCERPFEVRTSPRGPRYLVVDARLRAGTLLDLSMDPSVVREKPSLEELRREFGEDITAIARWDE